MASNKSDGGLAVDLRSRFRSWLPWIILALLGLGPLFACAVIGPVNLGGDLGLKAAPDWSRGLRIGTGFYGVDGGAPLAVDEEGKVHLVWALRPATGEYDLHYARLDDRGIVEEEHDLNLDLYEPRRVRLLTGSEGFMHVFLLALPERGRPSSLFHLTLDGDGQVEEPPSLISSGSRRCNGYDVTEGPERTFHFFWTEVSGSDSILFHSTWSPSVGAAATPQLLATRVSRPVARSDRDGNIHLLWEQRGDNEEKAELYYAALGGELPTALTGMKLLDLTSGRGQFRVGPVLALDGDYAYLVWTVEYRGDITAPAISEGWYGSFDLGSPTPVSARPFYLPMDERPTYVPHDSPYNYEYLVSSDGEAEFGSERTTGPSVLIGQEEAVVSCGMTVLRGVALEHQIINVIFGDGELIGYQLACNTTHWSRLPSLVSDSSGELHLSWVDGLEPGPSEVYYATTSPFVRGRVDHMTSADLVLVVLNTAFSAAVGAAMLPFVVLWVVPSLIWVFISGFFLGDGGLRSRRGYVALGIALLIYQLGKLYFTPALLGYIPFSASVPFLAPYLYGPLRVVVPVCIVGVGVMAVIYAVVRAETRSLLTASMAFIAPEAFLTVVVYGPGLARMG
jgi:hypothetical protein